MKKLLVPAIALTAGAAGGWFLRGPQSPHSSTSVPAGGGEPASASAPSLPDAKSDAAPEGAAAGAKTSLAACREIAKAERNPARATVKILALLDSMDAAGVQALAQQCGREQSGWWDESSGMVLNLVYTRLAELSPASAMQSAMQTKDQWTRMAAAGAVAVQLARTNPAMGEAFVQKMPPGYLRRNLTADFAGALAKADGAGALAFMQRMKVPPNDWSWNRFLSSWAGDDPAAASASLAGLPHQVALNNADAIAGAWARRDPGAALTWAQSLKDNAQRRSALGVAIGVIARDDPERATALAAAQPAGERRTMLQSIASSMASADGPAAVKWAESLTDPAERQRSLAVIAGEIRYSDLDTARAAIERIPPGALRKDALEGYARSMSWIDPAGAKEWLQTLKPGEQSLVMGEIAANLASSDMEAAEKMAADMPPGENNAEVWRNLAGQKALKDPAAALAWAGALESEQARIAATSAVYYQWAQQSPQDAAAALGGISDANQRRRAAEDLASNWAQRSPAEAEQWAATLSGDDRIAALAAVWNASATDDPQRAARSLAETAATAGGDTATDKLSASAAQIASAWTGQNPTEAATWAGTLPDGKVREQALGQVAGEWARYDPEAASAWINTLPHDRSRDAAIGQLVNRIAASDPQSAFTWATSMQAGEKQTEVLKGAAQAWKNLNPEAARAAVQDSALPEDVRARVMESLR